MKTKIMFISAILVITFLSSGCASANAAISTSASTNGSSTPDSENNIPTEVKLIAGSYKMTQVAGTFTSDEARQMAILWQAYKELLSRDTAATQEKEAILTQIENTFTKKQTQEFTDLDLTVQDVIGLVREVGVNSNTSSSITNTVQVPSAGGNGFGGGGPAFDGSGRPPADMAFAGGPDGQMPNLTTEQKATLQASRASGTGLSTMAQKLIDPLIAEFKMLSEG